MLTVVSIFIIWCAYGASGQSDCTCDPASPFDLIEQAYRVLRDKEEQTCAETCADGIKETLANIVAVLSQVQEKLDTLEKIESTLENVKNTTALIHDLKARLAASETKLDAAETRLAASEAKLNASETRLAASEAKLDASETRLAASEVGIRTITNDVNRLKSDADLENRLAASVRIRTITNDVSRLKSKKEAVIISAAGGLRDSNCVKVCAGTTPRGSTDWRGGGSYVYVDISISKCGFVTVPTITTSLEGSRYHNAAGSAQIYMASTSMFRVYVKTHRSTSNVNSVKWNVEWVAVGYTC